MNKFIKKVAEPWFTPYFEDQRNSYSFEKKIFHYGPENRTVNDKYENAKKYYISESKGDWYSHSYQPASYDGIGFEPVVEVWQVNPNQVVFAENPDVSFTPGNPSNLLITAGGSQIADNFVGAGQGASAFSNTSLGY